MPQLAPSTAIAGAPNLSKLWSNWELLPGEQLAGDLSAVVNQDGRLEVFGRGKDDGGLYHTWQQLDWTGWAPLTRIGGLPIVGEPAAVVNQDGRLTVFAHGTPGEDDALLATWQDATGWATLTRLNDGTISSDPAVGVNKDGSNDVFALIDGSLCHTWPDADYPTGWTPLYAIETTGTFAGNPAVGVNHDGRLEVFARGKIGDLWHTSQPQPNSEMFPPLESLHGSMSGNPAVGVNKDGSLEVFARDAIGIVSHIWQTSPGADTWSEWTTLTDFMPAAGDPVVVANTDGRLEVFFRGGGDNILWHAWQTSPGPDTTWSEWTQLSDPIIGDPAVVVNTDGRLEVFVLGPDGALWHRWQINDRNIEMKDAIGTFNKLCTDNPHYDRAYYIIDHGPVDVGAMLGSHFKGISAYAGDLIFTHTDIYPEHLPASVGKIPIGPQPDFNNTLNAGKPFDVEPDNLHHPCSSQACGQYMAMGLQRTDDDYRGSCIQFYDLSPLTYKEGKQITLIGSIPWGGSNDGPWWGINGVGFGKQRDEDGGKYVLAGINGYCLQIFTSASSKLVNPDGSLTTFTKVFGPDDGTHENFPESGCGLALITQQDGTMFLVTMDGAPKWGIDYEPQPNYISLYQLDLKADPPYKNIIFQHPLPVADVSSPVARLYEILHIECIPHIAILSKNELNANFRWGKGLQITSEDSFRVFASDRNSIPWDQSLGGCQFDKDFSVCVWDTDKQ